VLYLRSYYNSVGSKEGWTPSEFKSSRKNRPKKDENPPQRRPEDFMDDEDLADLHDAQRIGTREEFAGFGSVAGGHRPSGGLADLFRARGETMGFRLLRKMGWKDGQGIGPRVLRKARITDGATASARVEASRKYAFAPDDIAVISWARKADRRGLGFGADSSESRLGPSLRRGVLLGQGSDDGGENLAPTRRGGIGVGVLNDSGSDEEDPYEVGPKITYNKSASALRKAKKPKREPGNAPAQPGSNLKSTLVSTAQKKLGPFVTRGGVSQLDGFVLSTGLLSSAAGETSHPIPHIPPGWSSSKKAQHATIKVGASQGPAAVGATHLIPHDPRSRAKVLGEAPLPGKSVFDFISAPARDKLVAATGKHHLPPARGEAAMGSDSPARTSAGSAPQSSSRPDKSAAAAALERDSSGRSPYASNAAKRSRYRQYLEYYADISSALPTRPGSMSEKDFLVELEEFYNCVGIFKPMTGFMASRFTTSSSSPASSKTSKADHAAAQAATSTTDSAAEAARLGMFGPLTRSITNFSPTRLLCKRFNVAVPTYGVAGDAPREAQPSPLLSVATLALKTNPKSRDGVGAVAGTPAPVDVHRVVADTPIDQSRPPDHVFRDIFGDSTDDE